MASLTQTAILTRKTIRYGIYLVILLIVARFAFNIGRGIYRRLFPPAPPPPTVSFGKLPKLPFPQGITVQSPQYSLETPDGRLPVNPPTLSVFYMPPFSSTLGALDEAKAKAGRLGFDPNGTVLVDNTPNLYRFTKPAEPASLTMNIINGVFSISYDLSSDPSATTGLPPAPDVAVQTVRGILSGAGLLNESLAAGPNTHVFLRLEGGQFVPAISLSESNLIKINLFRKPYEKIPSVTPNGSEANVWFLLGRGGKVIAAEYHFFPIDETKISTYPLKTAEAAWNELQRNEAYIASYTGGRNIVIRRVYLAYYDPGQQTEFYQPVVVFEGDNDFAAYVPAVTSEFYGAEVAN